MDAISDVVEDIGRFRQGYPRICHDFDPVG
jgi:hypothetical protein